MTAMFDFAIPLPTFFILLGLLLALMAMWALQLRKNDYDILDLFMEGEPRKASVNKHILIGFALLSVWLVIMRTLDAENTIPSNVDSLLLGVLGIFVLGRAANQAVDRFSRRAPASTIVDNAQNVTIEPPPTR